MSKIKVAIAGVGNCAASLIQGIEYYRAYHKHLANGNGKSNGKKKKESNEKFENVFFGLMNEEIGGFRPDDIEIVAAFDIDTRKVGQRFDVALKSKPNCVLPLWDDVPKSKVIVEMGPIFDGFSEHMKKTIKTIAPLFLPTKNLVTLNKS